MSRCMTSAGRGPDQQGCVKQGAEPGNAGHERDVGVEDVTAQEALGLKPRQFHTTYAALKRRSSTGAFDGASRR